MPPLSFTEVKLLETVSTSGCPVIESGIIDEHLYIYFQSITAITMCGFQISEP